eukprot:Phypoly_transcript_00250.p1 GENE.Phypoly_transcript_00250~~Phypoly_transcript_00250.p1  ORF type:complete len:1049 (-),score=150.38 Phypoly_transcript_00250:103-3249(-)
MAMFFDDTKKINLSGNKAKAKKEGKEQFIQRTRVEREERKQDKAQRAACARVVRFLRFTRFLREAQRNERRLFDEEIVFAGSKPLQRDVLVPLMRQFLFFQQEPIDDERFILLAQRLMDNVAKEQDTKANYCGLAVDNPSTFGCQIKKYLRVCLHKLSHRQSNYACQTHAAKSLVVFTSASHWKYSKDSPSLPSLTSACESVQRYLVEKEHLYSHLRAHFTEFIEDITKNKLPSGSIPKDQWNAHCVSAVTLAVRPMLTEPTFTELFVAHLLTIPSFITKMPSITTQILLSTQAAQKCLETLTRKLKADRAQQMQFLTLAGSDPSQNAMFLLGNALALQRASKVEYDVDFILSLLGLCKQSKGYDSFLSSQLSCLYSPETVMSFFGKLGSSKPPPEQIDNTPSDSNAQKGKRHHFTSSIFSYFGLSSASSTSREGNTYTMVPLEDLSIKDTPPEDVIDVDRLANIVEIYLELMERFPFVRLSVLNTLTFSTPLTRSLWMWMCAYGIQKRELTPKLTRLLTLFCECYSHLLLVLDDSEFYGENPAMITSSASNYNSNNNFAISEVVGMLRYLKKLVLDLFQTDNADLPLRDAATRLVNQLYERESRRSFCPPQFWIFKEIKYEAFFNVNLDEETAAKLRKMIHTVPWSCSFETRVKIFSAWITADRTKHPTPLHRPTAQIRRGHELEDGLVQLQRYPSNLIKSQSVRIVFINSSGVVEEGIDQGGLFKEFVSNILVQGFNPNRSGLFVTTPSHTLYPNPKSYLVHPNHLVIFELLGKFLAKAIYDGVVVDLPLAGFFMSKILGKYNFFHELSTMDTELYKNLLFIKHYEGNLEDLSLTFSVSEDDGVGNVVVKDLIPNGREQAVTNSNRAQYIYLMADYYLNKSIEEQCRAFVSGFQEIIPYEWTHIFSPTEIQQIISGGSSQAIDVDDMQRNTKYHGYSSASHVIRNFWKVVREMTPEEQKKLVKFVTGYPKPPLMGFAALRPELSIRKVEGEGGGVLSFLPLGGDVDRLPSASVCFNMLKLPNYKKMSTLKEKLLYAINSSTGFELS